MVHMGGEDPFAELKRSHRDYKVFDAHYERIGKVDELFVDEGDHPVYLSVSTGFLDSGSVLVPMEMVRINDKRGLVEVDTSRRRIDEAPSLRAGGEVSPEVEDNVRIYYGLKPLSRLHPTSGDVRGQAPATEDQLAFDERIDLVPGEREAGQEGFEGDPPYRERSEQLRREREALEQEDAERNADSPGSPFDLREPGESGGREVSRGEPSGSRVRRFSR